LRALPSFSSPYLPLPLSLSLSLSLSLCYHLLVATIFFVFSPTSFSYVVEVVGRNVYIHMK
jgi:hypothetical protein